MANNPYDIFKATLPDNKKAEFQTYRDYYRKAYNDPKTAFVKQWKPEEVIALWRKAQRWHMNIDGVNCWFDPRSGLFFNYVAMKNAVFSLYPKARFDVQIVLTGDEFTCGRTEQGVTYTYKKADPFADLIFKVVKGKDGYEIEKDTNFVGAFGVFVANDETGTEVLELLGRKDLEQIVQTSRQISQWNKWAGEYIMKTILKRVCKRIRQDDRDFQDLIDFDNSVNGNDFNNKEPSQITDQETQEILNEMIIEEINRPEGSA